MIITNSVFIGVTIQLESMEETDRFHRSKRTLLGAPGLATGSNVRYYEQRASLLGARMLLGTSASLLVTSALLVATRTLRTGLLASLLGWPSPWNTSCAVGQVPSGRGRLLTVAPTKGTFRSNSTSPQSLIARNHPHQGVQSHAQNAGLSGFEVG